jgi:hypothetical protein
MKVASGLTLVTAGAILAFAVTAQTPFINLQVAGIVLMLAGAVGLVMPRRGYGWLRRRMITRRGPGGLLTRVDEKRYPPYVKVNPDTSGAPFPPAGEATMPHMAQDTIPTEVVVDPGVAPPAQETVEEYFED